MKKELEDKFAKVVDDVHSLSVVRQLVRDQMSLCERDADGLRYDADVFQNCADVFKAWLEDLLEKNVGSMGDLVTSGLQHIINDQDLTFRFDQEMKFNRLSMKFIMGDGDIEGDPTASFGGGAVLTASFILRIAIMSRLGMGNLLLLDESMHALANKYVPAAGSFMRQLSERTGINILMVTHNEEFSDHAHTSYEGWKDGSFHLRRRR